MWYGLMYFKLTLESDKARCSLLFYLLSNLIVTREHSQLFFPIRPLINAFEFVSAFSNALTHEPTVRCSRFPCRPIDRSVRVPLDRPGGSTDPATARRRRRTRASIFANNDWCPSEIPDASRCPSRPACSHQQRRRPLCTATATATAALQRQ